MEKTGKSSPEMSKKEAQFAWFSLYVRAHIRDYVVPQYGDIPDKMVEGFTPEKIQGKLEHYVGRIGKGMRGHEDNLKDCLKIAHFACYLYSLLKHGDAQADLLMKGAPDGS